MGARVGGQMPRGRPEQVSAPCTSHPMGDAGPRWSNEVQQGGETKKMAVFAVNIMQT